MIRNTMSDTLCMLSIRLRISSMFMIWSIRLFKLLKNVKNVIEIALKIDFEKQNENRWHDYKYKLNVSMKTLSFLLLLCICYDIDILT